MVHGIPNISVAYMLPHTGRMSLPVDSSSLVYSYFQHVSGIAAPADTQGQTITKLNLLDVLIGQLNQLKKGNAANFQIPADSKNLDSLIENYNNQIRQAKTAGAAKPYTQSPSAQSGLVFSLLA